MIVAIRGLRRNPGFTLIAVLTLALGIGANTAMFSVVNAVLLRPYAGFETDRLVVFDPFLAPEKFEEIRRQATSFESIAAHNFCIYSLTGEGEPEQVAGPCTTANWFDVQHAQALLGRTFAPDEDQHGRERVVVLDHGFWQRRFGGDRNVIGRRILLDRHPYVVIGVMPPGFAPMFDGSSVYTPRVLADDRDTGLRATARLKPGVSRLAAQDEMAAIASRAGYRDLRIRLHSLIDLYTGSHRQLLLLLLGAAAFVLLIACVNVASLFVARSTARRHEIDIRIALGAPRGRLIGFVLGEALVISALAAVVAVGVAFGSMRLLRPLLANVPRVAEIRLDTTVLLWTLGIALLSALLFGIAPALRSTRHSSAAGMSRRSTARWQSSLIVAEVALAFVLLVGAGLVIRSFAAMRSADLGYQPTNVLTTMMTLPPSRDGSRAAGLARFARVREGIARVPGVRAVATTSALPMGGVGITMDVHPEGEPERHQERQAAIDIVSEAYFRVMGIAVRAGRGFTRDDREGAPPVVIVSESVARRYFGGRAVGRRMVMPDIQFNVSGEREIPMEIVGVVADVRVTSVSDFGAEHIYMPEQQAGIRMTYIVARTDRDPLVYARDVRRAAFAEEPDTPLDEVRSLESRAAYLTAGSRQATWLLGVFAALAFALAAAGIYGVSAYLAAQRRREIGIRMALGATPGHIAAFVYGGSLRAAAAGLLAGCGAALLLTRLLEAWLFGISAHDPVTLLAAGMALLVLALIASTGPALTAAHVNPVEVLKAD